MTEIPQDDDADRAADLGRLNAVRDHFSTLNTLLAAQIAAADEADPATAQDSIATLLDLKALFGILRRAEADFSHDHANKEADDALDLSTIRAEIGRALDRVRASLDAKEIPR